MDNKHKNTMSGDHPSFTKSKLNLKDENVMLLGNKSMCKLTSLVSNVEKETPTEVIASPDNKELLSAAMGSLRWPPYLLIVWMFLLLVTHLLHCLLSVITFLLPHTKLACDMCREWCTSSLKHNVRMWSALCVLACVCVHSVYCVLYAMHNILVWAIQPLAINGRQIEHADYDDD